MITVYVNKLSPSSWLIHPAPVNLADYHIANVDEGVDLTDKMYDVKTEQFVIDTVSLAMRAEHEKRYRLSQAATALAPLQYAVDLNMATNGEQAALTEWKKYCVLLNRVDCSAAPKIDWPKAPE
ncbi:tail fiber assembly protein [Xenorhabdus bovienii]|uniref:tail fiber assembly protein n=1 Tax=Xenorhabdus bovienii TaxID=40576 RepID=UPI0023B0EF9A|nr:tail fiber assembly protein [Xenorhabdus bovienii]MDE9477075.1 tail fiber assembly protein [Xenorhabdus bovienii]MDE9529992.1 tail fiber assembly protein [Xenorhabdus bovienii]